ncbi:MAG TPA: S8/S53 family peptidase [Ktedonobacteraceae bacterium]|nr:S8/S53 family peptidase [Ktedonobacteraceae bacterium]
MSRSPIELMGTPDELCHWIPGEIVVIVQLPRRLTNDEQEMLVEQILDRLNSLLARYDLALEAYGTAGRWHVIPTMPPIRRRSFIFGLHKQLPYAALFFHVRHNDVQVLDPMPMALSYLHANLEQLAQEGLSIVSAMPNWLVTAAPVYYGFGGPVFPPRSAPTPQPDKPTIGNTATGWHLSIADQSIPLDRNGAEDVTIAILDTAHHPDRVRSAATRPELRRNWLLQRLNTNLRSENGSFTIEYDRYPVTNDVRTGRDAENDPRYYFMPDHGLFVTGLIRDIAPRARLRLIRILNDFGGCDLYNLFAALTDLEHELESGAIRRLVINLSLTVMPDIRRLPYVWFDHRQWQTLQLSGVIRMLQSLEDGLILLFDALYAQGALMIAAAGNDSVRSTQKGLSPRSPRVPASYATTLSVTSVNSHYQPSRFANAANVLTGNTGISTFGGDDSLLAGINDIPDAVRGLYISPTFPLGEQNITGWADWSGTSFSTAIISALAAHLVAQGLSVPEVMTRIASGHSQQNPHLYGKSPDAPTLLANIVRVQQFFGS